MMIEQNSWKILIYNLLKNSEDEQCFKKRLLIRLRKVGRVLCGGAQETH